MNPGHPRRKTKRGAGENDSERHHVAVTGWKLEPDREQQPCGAHLRDALLDPVQARDSNDQAACDNHNMPSTIRPVRSRRAAAARCMACSSSAPPGGGSRRGAAMLLCLMRTAVASIPRATAAIASAISPRLADSWSRSAAPIPYAASAAIQGHQRRQRVPHQKRVPRHLHRSRDPGRGYEHREASPPLIDPFSGRHCAPALAEPPALALPYGTCCRCWRSSGSCCSRGSERSHGFRRAGRGCNAAGRMVLARLLLFVGSVLTVLGGTGLVRE